MPYHCDIHVYTPCTMHDNGVHANDVHANDVHDNDAHANDVHANANAKPNDVHRNLQCIHHAM